MTSVPPYSADEAPTEVISLDPARPQPPTAGRPGAGVPVPRQPGDGVPVAGVPGGGPGSGAGAQSQDGRPPGRRHMLRYLGIAASVVVLLLGIGVAAYATAGDIPRGTTVLGTELGGLSSAEARQAVELQVGPRTTTPVRVSLDGRTFQLRPADVGLVLDVAATVDEAAKGGPRLFGDRDVPPVIRVDAKKVEAQLRKRLDPKSVTVKQPTIRYAGVKPQVTYPEPGRDLDPGPVAELVRAAWLTGAVVQVPLVERPPAMTREQVDALVTDLAAPAVAKPVTVTAGSKSFTLTPQMIAASVVFRADAAGVLSAAVDPKKLRAAGKSALATVEVQPKDATITLAGGKPKVLAGTAGTSVDTAKLSADLLPVLRAPDNRRVQATLKEQQAAATQQDMVKLGVKEQVSTFTTRFPGGLSAPRSQNIVTIAKEVDGALVKPGETFSLNRHTGIRSYPQGYKDAPVILGGRLEPGVGGGASQFTTTLFNAAYYAGLQDVEHKPHSFYFSRYPAVIESTIFYPDLDLKFKNTTPYGILIDTSHTASTVTVAMWSTKFYDSVTTERSPRRNITSPPTVYRDPGPKCIATGGLPGFTQDAYRVIRKDGKLLKREKFSWRYDPEPRFICAKEPS